MLRTVYVQGMVRPGRAIRLCMKWLLLILISLSEQVGFLGYMLS